MVDRSIQVDRTSGQWRIEVAAVMALALNDVFDKAADEAGVLQYALF